MFLSHADYADFTEGTCSARAAIRDIPHSSPESGEVPPRRGRGMWICSCSTYRMYHHVRPERPKAHSPGQGEQRELTPWVYSIPTTRRPEGAKALNHTNKYVGLSRIGVELLPFQGATYVWGIYPRVSFLAVACPGLGAIAPSGRGMIVHSVNSA